MKITDQIKSISTQISDDELSRLRIEEELLIMLVRSSKHSLKIKSEAFERIKTINTKQLDLLGSATKKYIKSKGKLDEN